MKHNGVFTDLDMEDGRSEAIFIAAEDLTSKIDTSCTFWTITHVKAVVLFFQSVSACLTQVSSTDTWF